MKTKVTVNQWIGHQINTGQFYEWFFCAIWKLINPFLACWYVGWKCPWLRDCPQNFTFALEASLLGQMFIFRTISQPRTLSADIPAACVDICPPIVSVEKPNKTSGEKPAKVFFIFSSLFFYMEEKQTRFVESNDGDIKKLVANAVPESQQNMQSTFLKVKKVIE